MTTSNAAQMCPYCATQHAGKVCWTISAIEYHPDGTIKRVEFHGQKETVADASFMRDFFKMGK